MFIDTYLFDKYISDFNTNISYVIYFLLAWASPTAAYCVGILKVNDDRQKTSWLIMISSQWKMVNGQ